MFFYFIFHNSRRFEDQVLKKKENLNFLKSQTLFNKETWYSISFDWLL